MRALTFGCWFVLAAACCTWTLAADIPEPELIGDSVTVKLGEQAAQLASGGGRYLVFHLKQARKLALFDVSALKIVHTLDMPADDVRFAAGQEKLLVVLPSQRLLHRYTLATLERERTVELSGDADVKRAVMGSCSAGPLLLWSNRKVALWDIDTLKPLDIDGEVLNGDAHYGYDIRVSMDGHTFTGWQTQISSQNYTLMRIRGKSATLYRSPDSFSMNGRFAQPTADD